jgi:hypothetical protein
MKKIVFSVLALGMLRFLTFSGHAEGVSNLSNSPVGDLWFGFSPVYVPFTTGTNIVRIDSFTLSVNTAGAPGGTDVTYTASIYSDNSGSIGSIYGTVGSFTDFTLGGVENISIAASSTVNLSPNTTYWLQTQIAGTTNQSWWRFTSDTSESGDPGWSIGNNAGWTGSGAGPTLFSVSTTAVPEPSTATLILGVAGGVLAFARRRR